MEAPLLWVLFRHFSTVRRWNGTFRPPCITFTTIPSNNHPRSCSQGRALLHWACDRGHKELVSVLLQHKADINSQVSSITSIHLRIRLRWGFHPDCWSKSCIYRQKPQLLAAGVRVQNVQNVRWGISQWFICRTCLLWELESRRVNTDVLKKSPQLFQDWSVLEVSSHVRPRQMVTSTESPSLLPPSSPSLPEGHL